MAAHEPNDPQLKSWVPVPDGSDFPIQNLPFGIFRTPGAAARAGIAIGDSIIDLAMLHDLGYLDDCGLPQQVFVGDTLNSFLALGRGAIRRVRERVSAMLRHDSNVLPGSVRDRVLFPQRGSEMLLPVRVPNYTDFYSSEEHAINVGSMFRDPENPLLPNWKHMPVGYHGRASSIVVSGTDVRRPRGQVRVPGSSVPDFLATRRLDFELEIAFITCRASERGVPVGLRDTDDYIAGFVLFNDWSARDIQQWEYVPLGPFLGKSFASTMSPWLVTLDALEPFRVSGPPQEPPVLPYLAFTGKRSFDIILDADLRPKGGGDTILCRTNARYLYWNMNQQLAHQTINGCNVEVGDVYASGTISGPSPGSFGSLLELSWNGAKPLTMADGSERTFLQDGDTLSLRGFASKDGVRIGFGECRGTILPAL